MGGKKETVVFISMGKLNIVVLLATIGMLFGVLVLHLLLFGGGAITFTFSGLLLFLAGMIIMVVIHEAIHLIGFRYIGDVPRKELAWGVNWKMGVAYAHAKKPITVAQMKKVLMLPFVPTGLLPLILGVSMNFLPISMLGVILTVGCFGDVALYRKVMKFPDEALVLDHPTKPQFTVYE
ncbi:DUF3267 domain-containing protein [Lentibacillus sediminis]|uniref:DUF3267 domain-containing protein n=1 Tax=Lentibacillus sediminis TaxID=1940529 RepID=UPI000C1C840D|nr:DUF3267 domain-containing protein [Lentibacillus sediminis]